MSASPRYKVLISHGAFVEQRDAPVLTSAGVEYHYEPIRPTKQRLLELIRGEQGPFNSFYAGNDPFDSDVLEAATALCPDQTIGLQVTRCGVGYDSVHVPTARRLKIMVTVTNIPEIPLAVAELAAAFTLEGLRNIPVNRREIAQYRKTLGRNVFGSTIGILGFGRIAQAFAQVIQAFRPQKILVYDPYWNDVMGTALTAISGGQRVDSIDALLRESDVLSVHVPHTPQTENLLGASQFALMKPDSILINTARGPIIDEKALLSALRQHRPGFFYGDVLWDESPAGVAPFLELNRELGYDAAVLTPHCATATTGTYAAMSLSGMEAIIRHKNGTPHPRQFIVPELW